MCGIVGSSIEKPTPSSSLCPRGTLANVIRKASEKHGVHLLVGFEFGFEIVRLDSSTDEVVPVSAGFGRYAMDGLRGPSFEYVEETGNRPAYAYLHQPPINEDNFLASILGRLPALCAFTLPYPAGILCSSQTNVGRRCCRIW